MTTPPTTYEDFLHRKSQLGSDGGFEPLFMPDFLFPFQRALVEWAVRKGRDALFADCGLGKTPMGLVWSQNVAMKTNRPVLYLTPLAVASQTVREADKFGIAARQVREQADCLSGTSITNYQKVDHFDLSKFGGVIQNSDDGDIETGLVRIPTTATVTGGNLVTIVAGNHDVDLYWPAVQQRLREVAR